MAVQISLAVRNALLSTIAAQVDSGTGPGQLRVYSGTQPATADTAPTGTLLLTFTLPKPAFSAPLNGSMSFVTLPPIVAVASASGTAGWARMVKSDGAAVLDGSVGISNTDFVISSAVVSSGQPIVLAATINMAT